MMRADGRSRLFALLVGWVAGLLYVSTLAPAVGWYDSAEFTTAAHVLGIPHPPGYPLYVLLAHPFTYLPGDPAWRVNLVSAVGGAVVAGLCVPLARRLGATLGGAVVSAATVATGSILWSNCVVAEVYAPALAVMLGVWLCLLRGLADGRAMWTVAAAFLAGLGLGLHLFLATCGLGWAWLVGMSAWTHAPAESRWRDVVKLGAAAIVAAALGSLVFVWLPVRAAMDPPLNFGDPSTWERFWWVVGGGTYGQHFEARAPGGRAWSLLQWGWNQTGGLLSIMAGVGAWTLARRRPGLAIAWGLAIAGNIGVFARYVVHDVEVFFLPAYVGMGLLVGLGFDRLGEIKHRGLRRSLQSLVLLLLAWHGVRSMVLADRGDDDAAARWSEAVGDALPPHAILLHFTYPPEWKYNAVFQYGQLVLGARPDVDIAEGAWTPVEVEAWLSTGRPVFAYAPLPALDDFELQPRMEGLYAVVRRRATAGSRPES